VNERDLVQHTLIGDREAYRELIHQYRNAVYGLVISFVGDFDQAEDLAQETFIRGYYRLHTLEDGSRFGSWLRTIAANLCRSEIRRRKALPVGTSGLDLDVIEGPIRPPDEIQEQDEARRQVLAALDALPQKEREAVTLYYLDGERVEAVGRFLGISAGAARVRLHRARRTLRKEIVAMAKKTLSQNKLGPKFSKQVELREFSDLARLTDDELKTLATRSFLPNARKDLIYALAGEDPETEALRERVLAALPRVEREMFKVSMEGFRNYQSPLGAYRNEAVGAARRLQREGAIRPAPKRRLPKGTVDVQRFCDLARLDDWEIQQLLREVDTKRIAAALVGEVDYTAPGRRGVDEVRKRVFANLSERIGRMILIEQTHRKPSKQDIEHWQGHILRVVHSLQAAGAIRPGTSPHACPRVEVRGFVDCLKLNDYEIQATLRETDTKDLAVALKAKGEGIRQVEGRMMVNMSTRVGKMVQEYMEHRRASRAEIEACQQKIVRTIKKLQVLGSVRRPSRRPTRRQYEKAVTQVAQDQIERSRHSGYWTPRDVKWLLPYLAVAMGEQGSEGAQEAFRGIRDPVLGLGLQLLAEGAPREELVQRLQDRAEEELHETRERYQQMISGMIGVLEGEDPRDIGDRL